MYLGAMALMIVSIPLSKFMMSVSQFTLAGTLLLDHINRQRALGFFKSPTAKVILLFIPMGIMLLAESVYRIFRKFFQKENLPAIIFSSIFLLHIIGLLYTTDLPYAFKDIRVKLPIFILPVIFSVSPSLDFKKFRFLILLFTAAVFAGTLISTQILLTQDITDTRYISIFISHIRFSLLIVYAFFILLFFIFREKGFRFFRKLIFFLIAIWFIIYLFISASMTGLVILSLTLLILLVIGLFRTKNIFLRIGVPTGIIVTLGLLIYFLISIANDVYKVHPVSFSNLDKKTAQGNLYWNDTSINEIENGYYVWIYIATREMRKAWNQRSDMDFDGEDARSQTLKFTLMRFLTSKGFRKDAEGVNKLSEEEINLVEQGVANVIYHEKSHFYVRLYKLIWGFKHYQISNNPSGMSLFQRFEYWKASTGILKDHWLTGVGTGDLDIAFDSQYDKMNSQLKEPFRWRSHNQLLAIFIGFGILGLIWFLITLLYPPIKLKMFSDYFYLSFFIIITLSMITEDTIETQAGATIFAFFTSLLLFGRKDKVRT